MSLDIAGNCGRLGAPGPSVSMSAPPASRFRFWLFLDLTVVKDPASSGPSAAATGRVVLSVSIAGNWCKGEREQRSVRRTEGYGRMRVSSCDGKDPKCDVINA